jgi:hypothetical protein
LNGDENRMECRNANFTGFWNANLGKSTLRGPAPKAISARIEHNDPELRAEVIVFKMDGSEQRVIFQCWTDGRPGRQSLNGETARGNARWEGTELILESWIQAGEREMHFRDCWSLSPDVQRLILEHRDDDLAGQLTILDRAD